VAHNISSSRCWPRSGLGRPGGARSVSVCDSARARGGTAGQGPAGVYSCLACSPASPSR
jgi:hypothetical protein